MRCAIGGSGTGSGVARRTVHAMGAMLGRSGYAAVSLGSAAASGKVRRWVFALAHFEALVAGAFEGLATCFAGRNLVRLLAGLDQAAVGVGHSTTAMRGPIDAADQSGEQDQAQHDKADKTTAVVRAVKIDIVGAFQPGQPLLVAQTKPILDFCPCRSGGARNRACCSACGRCRGIADPVKRGGRVTASQYALVALGALVVTHAVNHRIKAPRRPPPQGEPDRFAQPARFARQGKGGLRSKRSHVPQ